jgi:16S rRNA (guanine527-N7)-methyltransferase
MGLKDIEARHIRAEVLAIGVQAQANRYDVIISKAVCKLNTFLDRAFPLLHHSGRIIAMKGASVEHELESAKSRIKGHALRLEKKAYRLPLFGINRTLIVLKRK